MCFYYLVSRGGLDFSKTSFYRNVAFTMSISKKEDADMIRLETRARIVHYHCRNGVIARRLVWSHVVDGEVLDRNTEENDRKVDVVPLQHHLEGPSVRSLVRTKKLVWGSTRFKLLPCDADVSPRSKLRQILKDSSRTALEDEPWAAAASATDRTCGHLIGRIHNNKNSRNVWRSSHTSLAMWSILDMSLWLLWSDGRRLWTEVEDNLILGFHRATYKCKVKYML